MKELSTVGEFFAESGGSPPLESIARTFTTDRLPDLLADLARAQAIVLTRLITPAIAPIREAESDELLTSTDVARLLNIRPEQVRRMAALRPARKRLSRKVIRYGKSAVLRLIKRSAA
jgi:hypothetical protein